jgi:hypothetical protein
MFSRSILEMMEHLTMEILQKIMIHCFFKRHQEYCLMQHCC